MIAVGETKRTLDQVTLPIAQFIYNRVLFKVEEATRINEIKAAYTQGCIQRPMGTTASHAAAARRFMPRHWFRTRRARCIRVHGLWTRRRAVDSRNPAEEIWKCEGRKRLRIVVMKGRKNRKTLAVLRATGDSFGESCQRYMTCLRVLRGLCES